MLCLNNRQSDKSCFYYCVLTVFNSLVHTLSTGCVSDNLSPLKWLRFLFVKGLFCTKKG